MPKPSAAAKPVGELLSNTFAFLKAHWVRLTLISVGYFLVVVTIGLLTLVSVVRPAGYKLLLDMETQIRQLEEVKHQIAANETDALKEQQQALRAQVKQGTESLFLAVEHGLPVIVLLILCAIWIGAAYVSTIYIFVFKPSLTTGILFKRATALALPLIGVGIWGKLYAAWPSILAVVVAIVLGIFASILHTTSFVPLVALLAVAALIAALVLFMIRAPRVFAARALYIGYGKSISNSVSISCKVTKGYWGKIVGNLIVAGLVVAVISYIITLPVTLITAAQDSVLVAVIAQVIVRMLTQMFGIVFNIVFIILLTQTIIKHPRHSA